jgi:drug/metabolite transporter superfamily protein YnfA
MFLVTLLAWTTTVSLFIVLKLAPLTRGAAAARYYAALGCLLPWLAGSMFWTRVRKRARLDIADEEATGFCYGIIFLTVGSAYGALVSIETVLLWVLTRVK